MRIVSLVPAATEIACAIGAAKDLVAVTHDCDYPPRVGTLPRVTRSTIAVGAGSRAIDDAVRSAAERDDSTFHIDADVLAAARPEVLLGQTLCTVCAVTVSQLPSMLSPAPVVIPLDGGSIEGVLADVVRVGEGLGREREAAALVGSLRARIADVDRQVAGASRPSVACLEWLDPLFNAGHWVPEQVSHAGGRDLFGEAGVPSIDFDADRLYAADPDFIFVMPCGFDVERAVEESRSLREDPRWPRLRAVRERRAYALDGNAYFSRPGPRLVDGIELLASILHPDRLRSDIRRIPL